MASDPPSRCRLLVLGFALLIGICSLPARALAHPQDGPHCDLRVVVSDSAVTWNIGLNLVFADELVGELREAFDVLDPSEEEALREALLEHFMTQNAIAINGEPVTPIVRRWEVGRADSILLPQFPRTGLRALTRIVAALEYPAPNGVETLELTWQGYPPDILAEETGHTTGAAPLMAIEAHLQAEGRVDIVKFLDSKPRVVWTATGADPADILQPVPAPHELTERGGLIFDLWSVLAVLLAALLACITLFVPRVSSSASGSRSARRPLIAGVVLSLGIGGSVALAWRNAATTQGTMTTEVADSIGRPLLLNTYHAFEHTDESVIYDLLERSTTGQALESIFSEIYSSVVVTDHDMGRAILSGVRVLEIDLLEESESGFRASTTWEATGSVYHWGHSHDRTYKYTAELSIVDADGVWKIDALRIDEQEWIGGDDADVSPALPEGFVL